VRGVVRRRVLAAGAGDELARIVADTLALSYLESRKGREAAGRTLSILARSGAGEDEVESATMDEIHRNLTR
jgi:hypothetical protein